MSIKVEVRDRTEAINLMAVLLAYGTGFTKAGNVLAKLNLNNEYNGNAKKMARSQGQAFADALGFGSEVISFLSHYDPVTRKWDDGSGDDDAVSVTL